MHPGGPDARHAFSQGFFDIAGRQTPKLQTIAIATADGEATHYITEGARDNAKKAGLRIVYDRSYPLNTTDFSPIVRAVQAANPDIFMINSYPLDSVGIIRSMNEIGYKPRLAGGVLNGLPAPVLKAQLGPLLNGIVNYEFWVPTEAMMVPGVMDMIKRYQERAKGEGVDPIGLYVPPWAYSFGQVLQQAIEGAQSIDDGKLTEYMRKATFKTFVGDVKFGPDGEWAEPRILFVQHRNIKNNDIMQFRDMSTMTVIEPSRYASGELVFPYENAKK
jgi:branched-chain amino acid transport system substrate-binding protein